MTKPTEAGARCECDGEKLCVKHHNEAESQICVLCERPKGAHSREALTTENEHGWSWKESACPMGARPFHPTYTFKAAPLPDTPAEPTLEEWMSQMYPGANLDKMEIPARICIEIAKSYAAARNKELEEAITDYEVIAANYGKQVRMLDAKIQEQAQAWLHENSAKVQLIEENARLREALAEAREAQRQEDIKAVCVFCRDDAKLVGNSHQLQSNISESGYTYVDCLASALHRESKEEK